MTSAVAALLRKFVLPFIAGICLAGAASSEGAFLMLALIAIGLASIFAGLPLGNRPA